MSEETHRTLDVAVGDYQVTGDAAALKAAAQAHVDDSRSLETVLGQYRAVQDAKAAGEPYDEAEKATLAQELNGLREATEILAGNLPGAGHTVSVGIGD